MCDIVFDHISIKQLYGSLGASMLPLGLVDIQNYHRIDKLSVVLFTLPGIERPIGVHNLGGHNARVAASN